MAGSGKEIAERCVCEHGAHGATVGANRLHHIGTCDPIAASERDVLRSQFRRVDVTDDVEDRRVWCIALAHEGSD